MTKDEYITTLRKTLSELSVDELERIISFHVVHLNLAKLELSRRTNDTI